MSDTGNHGALEGNKAAFSSWVMGTFGVLALYLLGMGPAAYLHSHFEALRFPLEVLYTPLRLLFNAEWAAPLQPYIQKYLEFWGG
ncbi:MAG: hypothetical protein WEB58_11685 [Planctomycetaceae bacterium]